jgi:hypothetical protein
MTYIEKTETALAEVRAEIARVDTKASILAGLSLAAITGGAALASKAHLTGFALAAAIATAALIGAALVLLGLAIRPALNGDHGFMRWASHQTEDDLAEDLIYLDNGDDNTIKVWSLSRATRLKYQRVRLAVDLLGAAIGFAALTALLSAFELTGGVR